MRTTSAPWEFDDADPEHPLAALRVPVVATTHPRWRYEVALIVSEPASGFGPGLVGVEPTEEEGRLVAAVIEYRMRYYNAGWAEKMRARPLDVDGSTNTLLLLKRVGGGWSFRRASWTSGPPMWPSYDAEPIPLPAVLDRAFGYGDGTFPSGYAQWREENAALRESCEQIVPGVPR